MVRSGRTDWYNRVIAECVLAPGDAVRLVDRPNRPLPLTRLLGIVFRSRASDVLAVAPGIAE